MANREFSKIERVMKDFSLGAGEGGTTVVANPTLEGNEENLTGLEVNGTKYKVPQGGSSGVGYGSDYYIFCMDFYDLVENKSLDVDKLIALCDKYELGLDSNPTNKTISLEAIHMNNSSNYADIFKVGYDSCKGGIYISLGYNDVQLIESSETLTIRELLIANKTAIEETTIRFIAYSTNEFYRLRLSNGSIYSIKLSEFMECIKE